MPCTMIDTGQALNHVRFRACGRPVICEGKISGGIQILRGFKYIKFDVDQRWNLV